MGELGRRVAVAVVGIPVVLALLRAGGWVLGAPLAALAWIGTHELYRFARSRGVRPFGWLGGLTSAGLVLVAVARPDFVSAAPGMLSLVGTLTAVSLVGALFGRGVDQAPLASVAVTVIGALYAGLSVAFVPLLWAMPERLAWTSLDATPWAGAYVVALPLAATWIGDAAAYFAGSAWGRSKLFPSVSPNKSWVGAWAGVGSAAAAGLAWYLAVGAALPGVPLTAASAPAVGAVLGVAAIVGDLIESLLKREAGVKDSGTLFPGHGGALDRLDALIATIPLAYLLLAMAERVA